MGIRENWRFGIVVKDSKDYFYELKTDETGSKWVGVLLGGESGRDFEGA